MTQSIGKLLGLDEALHHQIADTFATITESDLSWTEKVWLTIPRKDGSLQIDFGLGRYHNRNVMDGFAGISRGKEQWTVRASRELGSDPEGTSIGPISYEILAPLRVVRIRLADNDIVPLSFELTFEGILPPFFEDRHQERDTESFRIASNVVRYHQAGLVSGWVRIDGKTHKIDQKDWFAFRDHSWGVRLDVGVAPSDLRPKGNWGGGGFGESQALVHWTPMLLERPDGSTYEFHYYLQARDGKPYYFSGYLNHKDGEQERVARVRPQLRYEDRTRRLVGGVVYFDMLSGETRKVDVEAVGDSGFYLGTALYLGFDGKKHGMWRGPLQVEGERISDVTDDKTLRRIHQVRDCIVRVREEDATGYGIFESVITGAWPELELTASASFV